MNLSVDLNCDLGEGAGYDEALMPLITSANVACGAHAGDAAMMRKTVQLAGQYGVAIGAHPGFADRENFGRRELRLGAAEIIALVRNQVKTLRLIAREAGVRVTFVKPHGALYNLAAREEAVADAIAEAVVGLDAELWMYGLAGSVALTTAQARGLRVAAEVFADRTYLRDGTLTPRDRPDALLHEQAQAVAQIVRMVREGKVRAVTGEDVDIVADTVCLHGDGEDPVGFARGIRAALKQEKIDLRALA